jgi:RNA polymerase sigma-54 factor
MHPSLQLSPRLENRLFLSQAVRQRLHLLQMPLLELKNYLNQEVEQNPLLEWKEDRSYEEKISFSDHFFSSIPAKEMASLSKKESLFEKLSQQIHEAFPLPKEREIAQFIVGNLDEKGFLSCSTEEVAIALQADPSQAENILKKIQTFDPLGVGCRTLQEFLLFQLKERKKEGSFAHLIVKEHFSSLLRYQFSQIEKTLKISHQELQQILKKDLSGLKFSPFCDSFDEYPRPILPDFSLQREENRWTFQYREENLLILHPDTLKVLSQAKNDEKKQMKIFFKRAINLIEGLRERKKTLKRIALYLLKHQISFFDRSEEMVPLTIKQMAEDLRLHPSTAARAIAHKYLCCPQGLFSLRCFFSSSLTTSDGQKISQKKALQLLKKLIQEEDKENPLSDYALSLLMKKAKIPCERRTIVKYRKELSIQSARRRKKLFHILK